MSTVEKIEGGYQIKDYSDGRTTTQKYDENWTLTSATISSTADGRQVYEVYGPGWQLTSASIQYQDADGRSVKEFYDGNWNLTQAEIITTANGRTVTEEYGPGWHLNVAMINYQTDNRSVTEYYGADWKLESAKIDTHGIVGQPFTSTHETYDANWNLTAWTGLDESGHVVSQYTPPTPSAVVVDFEQFDVTAALSAHSFEASGFIFSSGQPQVDIAIYDTEDANFHGLNALGIQSGGSNILAFDTAQESLIVEHADGSDFDFFGGLMGHFDQAGQGSTGTMEVRGYRDGVQAFSTVVSTTSVTEWNVDWHDIDKLVFQGVTDILAVDNLRFAS